MSLSSNERVGIAVVALRFSLALSVAFLVAVVSPSVPVRLLRYDWQYGFAETIRTGTPLAILAIGFLLLALSHDMRTVVSSRFFQVVRRLSGWIALAYFLLIPWQAAAGFFEIQRVDFGARSELTVAVDVLDRVAKANTPEQLRAVVTSVPALAQQLSVQPTALDNFKVARSNLLRNGRANLKKVKLAIKQKSDSSYRRFWFLLIQNSLILAAYGWAFSALSVKLKTATVDSLGSEFEQYSS